MANAKVRYIFACTKTKNTETPTNKVSFVFELGLILGVANGECETLRDGETSVFLCETETF